MTPVPPPASPCLRVRLDYTSTAGNELGSRFYLSYAGSAPTGGNCNTLAADIAAAWNTDMAEAVCQDYSLVEVDVLDIATNTGLSGSADVSHPGTDTNPPMQAQCCTNVEFDIARRYRGGKPRMYWPPPSTEGLASPDKFSNTFIGSMNTQVAAFFAAVEALSVGAVGALQHVNLSYYEGFTNITNSSGRTRAVPKYRAAALLDPVTGYATKAVVGSQRRRRTSTTY